MEKTTKRNPRTASLRPSTCVVPAMSEDRGGETEVESATVSIERALARLAGAGITAFRWGDGWAIVLRGPDGQEAEGTFRTDAALREWARRMRPGRAA